MDLGSGVEPSARAHLAGMNRMFHVEFFAVGENTYIRAILFLFLSRL